MCVCVYVYTCACVCTCVYARRVHAQWNNFAANFRKLGPFLSFLLFSSCFLSASLGHVTLLQRSWWWEKNKNSRRKIKNYRPRGPPTTRTAHHNHLHFTHPHAHAQNSGALALRARKKSHREKRRQKKTTLPFGGDAGFGDERKVKR